MSYKSRIDQQLDSNLALIAQQLRLSMPQIERAQEKHLAGVDLTFVLGVEEFMMQQVPTWLSGERAIAIYEEIKQLTIEMVEDVRFVVTSST